MLAYVGSVIEPPPPYISLVISSENTPKGWVGGIGELKSQLKVYGGGNDHLCM